MYQNGISLTIKSFTLPDNNTDRRGGQKHRHEILFGFIFWTTQNGKESLYISKNRLEMSASRGNVVGFFKKNFTLQQNFFSKNVIVLFVRLSDERRGGAVCRTCFRCKRGLIRLPGERRGTPRLAAESCIHRREREEPLK